MRSTSTFAPSAIDTSGSLRASSSTTRGVPFAARRAVGSTSCINPKALAALFASGLNADSSRITPQTRAGPICAAALSRATTASQTRGKAISQARRQRPTGQCDR